MFCPVLYCGHRPAGHPWPMMTNLLLPIPGRIIYPSSKNLAPCAGLEKSRYLQRRFDAENHNRASYCRMRKRL